MKHNSTGIKVFVFGVWVVVVGCNLPAATAVIEKSLETATPLVIVKKDTLEPVTSAPAMTGIPLSTAIPTLGIDPTQVLPEDSMMMVSVPAGEFLMGSTQKQADAAWMECGSPCNKDIYDAETPQHRVTLDAFSIDKTEVTNGMYARCVEAGICTPPGNTSSSTQSSYYGNPLFDNYPVIYVDWNQAKVYCEWVGKRLPSEAEWEKAARGTDKRTFPWGEGIDCTKVNYIGEDGFCYQYSAEVGSSTGGASPYGVLDMAGNVQEWVADWYSETYYNVSPSMNPQGPSSGQYRVLRGGSSFNNERDLRTSSRARLAPGDSMYDTGFRCALSP